MSEKISPERLELLTKMGFKNPPDCDPTDAFFGPSVALDTMMSVRGDHADDHAYVYYACLKEKDEVLDGLFYAPSLLEHPLLNYQKWNIEPILVKIADISACYARLVSVGGIPMLFIEIDEYDWQTRNLRLPLSDMLKLVGLLDYFLPRELKRMLEENK